MPWAGATLATSGGLMFSGSTDGHFMAFDAKTGKVLWSSEQLSSGIIGVPTTYKVDGKQYVAVWAGWGGAGPIWGGQMANDPAVKSIPKRRTPLCLRRCNKTVRNAPNRGIDPRRGAHAPRRGRCRFERLRRSSQSHLRRWICASPVPPPRRRDIR